MASSLLLRRSRISSCTTPGNQLRISSTPCALVNLPNNLRTCLRRPPAGAWTIHAGRQTAAHLQLSFPSGMRFLCLAEAPHDLSVVHLDTTRPDSRNLDVSRHIKASGKLLPSSLGSARSCMSRLQNGADARQRGRLARSCTCNSRSCWPASFLSPFTFPSRAARISSALQPQTVATAGVDLKVTSKRGK